MASWIRGEPRQRTYRAPAVFSIFKITATISSVNKNWAFALLFARGISSFEGYCMSCAVSLWRDGCFLCEPVAFGSSVWYSTQQSRQNERSDIFSPALHCCWKVYRARVEVDRGDIRNEGENKARSQQDTTLKSIDSRLNSRLNSPQPCTFGHARNAVSRLVLSATKIER